MEHNYVDSNYVDRDAVKKILKNGGHIWVLDTQIGTPGLSSNGGAYDAGITVLVAENGSLVGARHWNSCDFASVCPGCGTFTNDPCCEVVDHCPRPDDKTHKAYDTESREEVEVYWRQNDDARLYGFLPVHSVREDGPLG